MSEMEILDEEFYNEEIMCFPKNLAYDFINRTGIIFLAEYNCTDMSGCIALFKRIDPKVVLIRTFSKGRKDTLYGLVNEKWVAKCPSNKWS